MKLYSSKCNEYLDESMFHNRCDITRKHNYWCKDCFRIYYRNYNNFRYNEDPEYRQRKLDWNKRNNEKLRAQNLSDPKHWERVDRMKQYAIKKGNGRPIHIKWQEIDIHWCSCRRSIEIVGDPEIQPRVIGRRGCGYQYTPEEATK